MRAHFIAVETDDDEQAIRYWFFDDDFLAAPGAGDDLPDGAVALARSRQG